MTRVATTALLLVVLARPLAGQRADIIIYGRVWTGDPTHPTAEAVAVRGERIVAVGLRRQMFDYIARGTRVLDNGRNLIIPGLGDAHAHFLAGGFQLVAVLLDRDLFRERPEDLGLARVVATIVGGRVVYERR